MTITVAVPEELSTFISTDFVGRPGGFGARKLPVFGALRVKPVGGFLDCSRRSLQSLSPKAAAALSAWLLPRSATVSTSALVSHFDEPSTCNPAPGPRRPGAAGDQS